jgi:hydrogenase nickel incorporation protein HypB
VKVEVKANILSKNDKIASEVNELFAAFGVFSLNLMGSPGCGKTSLLERTLAELSDLRIAVVEGDLFTTKDSDRIARYGVPVTQINTSGGCHLTAGMVKDALGAFELGKLDVVVIENVGNLVCPAEFNIGEDARAIILSVTEGDDKPLKYPLMFKQASVALLNKVDLLPYTSFDVGTAVSDITSVNPGIGVIELSCRTGEGMPKWYNWLRRRITEKKTRSKI